MTDEVTESMRRSIGSGWAFALCASIGLVAIGLAWVAPVHAASRCQLGKYARVLERSASGVVFTRRAARRAPALTYGCLDRVGRAHRLWRQESPEHPPATVRSPKLAGRYVGFVTRSETLMDPPVERVRVVDLRTGRKVVDSLAITRRLPLLGYGVVDFVLKANGSVAWIGGGTVTSADFTAFDRTEVHRRNTGAADEVLDAAVASEAAMLSAIALSSDGSTIYWTHAGQPRAARLS